MLTRTPPGQLLRMRGRSVVAAGGVDMGIAEPNALGICTGPLMPFTQGDSM